MYSVENSKEGWKVKRGQQLICCVPSEKEAQTVARILQQDHDCNCVNYSDVPLVA